MKLASLYEVTQFESAWIRVAIYHGYKIVNSWHDQKRGLNTFSGIKQVASARSIPIEYLEEIKNSEGKFFFLPNEYIDGLEGA